MICVDTNVLIYAHRRGAVEHARARRAIERAVAATEGWGFALASVSEFWAQVTHPRSPGGPSTAAQARDFLSSLVQTGGARVFMPGPGFFTDLLRCARSLDVSGPRVFDLQIALAALNAGARRLWTHDAGFVHVPGLTVEDPLE